MVENDKTVRAIPLLTLRLYDTAYLYTDKLTRVNLCSTLHFSIFLEHG